MRRVGRLQRLARRARILAHINPLSVAPLLKDAPSLPADADAAGGLPLYLALAETMSDPCKPFLKWPGGKRWAAGRISGLISRYLASDGCYFEPFLGGGAVYFFLRPSRAVLADANAELMNVYRAVMHEPEALISGVKVIRVSSSTYYQMRKSKPRAPLQRAVRFLYLNRTAWGGIYRVNANGTFNVPFGGRRTDVLWERDLVISASAALQKAALRTADFAETLRQSRRGDVVYCDPTYTVAHDHNGFIRYNESNFTWSDQLRLAKSARAARRRGVTVLVSNAHHSTLKALYSDAKALTLRRPSTVSRTALGRRSVSEYLFVLAP